MEGIHGTTVYLTHVHTGSCQDGPLRKIVGSAYCRRHSVILLSEQRGGGGGQDEKEGINTWLFVNYSCISHKVELSHPCIDLCTSPD